MMTVFLILTILHHLTVNRYLSPLEEYLPLDIFDEAPADSNDDSATLVTPESSLSQPPLFIPTLPSFLPTRILPSLDQLMPHLTSSRTSAPTYTESQLKNAYAHPAMTAKPPVVWIPRDPEGISEEMQVRNKERAELETTDDGADLDGKGNVVWDEADL